MKNNTIPVRQISFDISSYINKIIIKYFIINLFILGTRMKFIGRQSEVSKLNDEYNRESREKIFPTRFFF